VAGYTRQSSADIIATAVVRANPLNVEYNAIRDAFSASTGHKHDGTTAEGAYVPLIADSDALNKVAIDTSNNRVGVFVEVSSAAVEQIRIQDGAIVPVTTNDIDLGTPSLKFKNLYLEGTSTLEILEVANNTTLTGNLTVNGNTTLGNAASDTVTITADVASPLIPSADDTHDLGAVGSEWRNLYIDGTANIDALVADTADINGGSIDGVTIGGSSAGAGTFTTLTATGTSTLTTVDINGGAIDGTIIGANSAAAITGTTITGTSLVGPVTGDVTGNADTATALETARTIGGVSFNGTANINLPGVNTSGNQDTSGNAATATALETARTIGGVSFDGTANISLPGVNTAGNQDTSGNAASATVLETARSIAGQSFDGSANITIAATDLSDTDQSLATSDNVQFASVTGNLTGNVTSTGSNSFGSIAVSGTSTLNGNTVIGNANSDTVTVTADVASNLIPSADSTYSLGDSSNYWSHGYIDAVTTTGNVIVGGDLTVNGTTTTVNSSNMTVADQLIELGNGRSGSASGDAGIVIERGSDANAFIGFDESADKFTVGTGTFTGVSTGDLTITTGTLVANIEGNITGNVSGDVTGNADTATALETARTIGGVSFDGTSNINLPGVNTAGNQNTSGNAATATALETARTIAGQSFDGTANISIAPTDLTGVNATAAEINYNDVSSLGTVEASKTVTADSNADVSFLDNDKITFGAGTDLQIFHDGTSSVIGITNTHTGLIKNLTNDETFISFTPNNQVDLYFDNSIKLRTENTGVRIVGDLVTTGTVTFSTLSDGTNNITDIVTSVSGSSTNAQLPSAAAVESRIQAVSATSNNVTGLTATGPELNAVADVSAITIDTGTAIASNDGIAVFDSSASSIGYFDVDLLDTYFSGTTKTLTNKTLTSPVVTGMHLDDSGFSVEGSSADGNETTVSFTNPTTDRTITFPDATGNVAVFTTAPAAAISDGTSGQVLTTNGSGVLSFATAASGADLYAANEVSVTAQPSATGDDAVAIGDSAVSSGANAIAFGFSSLASGFNAISIGNGEANNSNAIAIGGNSLSSGVQSFAGGHSAVSTGSYSHATTNSYASGSSSFAAAIANNSASYGATGANSIAMGKNAKATALYNVGIGGFNATASGSAYALALGSYVTASANISTAIGVSNNASGSKSIAIGDNNSSSSSFAVTLGSGNVASSASSLVLGNHGEAAIIGKIVFSNGYFSARGDSQAGQYILRADTTDATPTVLTTDNSAAGNNDQIIAANDTCIMFSGTLVAMQDGAQDQGGWEIKGLLKNDGGTTTLVSSNIQTFADGNGWVVALTADNTNNALAITCTGEASHNIRWVANIHTSEVTYA